METIFSQHGRGIEGDVFRGRNSRITAGHILARCGYGFRVHIGQYLTNQLLHCLPVYPWRSRGLRCFRAIHIVGHGVDQELCLAPTLLVLDRGYLLVAWVTGIELDGKSEGILLFAHMDHLLVFVAAHKRPYPAALAPISSTKMAVPTLPDFSICFRSSRSWSARILDSNRL